MLDRTERVHAEMLLGAAGAAKPRVVRHVHHQPRAIPHKLSDKVGEDALVTDHHAVRGWRALEHDGSGTGLQLGNELRPAPDETDESRERNELTEWNEMDFIISSDDALIGQHERGVTEPRGIALGIDRAHEQWRLSCREAVSEATPGPAATVGAAVSARPDLGALAIACRLIAKYIERLTSVRASHLSVCSIDFFMIVNLAVCRGSPLKRAPAATAARALSRTTHGDAGDRARHVIQAG